MGVYLSSPNKEKNSNEGKVKHISYASCSMQGWRTNMEDAHITSPFITDTVSVFGVFDGHGGREVAKFVEKHFVEELKKNQNFINGKYQEALEETFMKMDDLQQTQEGKKELAQLKNGGDSKNADYSSGDSYAGCTANVALLCKDELYIANAGDSRTVLCSKGQAVELSIDHKPDLENERERVKKAGGFISDGRINGNLNLSRAIGDLEYKKNENFSAKEQLIISFPEVKKKQIVQDDEFILMGCDGIWETLQNQELINFIRERLKKKESPKKILEELLDNILAPDTQNGFGCDNMTSILVVFKDFGLTIQ